MYGADKLKEWERQQRLLEQKRQAIQANQSRLASLRMQSNKPAPKQSFFNKVRDTFDANTPADQYRREQKGQARLYADQQKDMGRTRISNNPFQRTTNTFRSLAETIKQPYENLGTGISTAFGEGRSLRDYEAQTQQENLAHVENLRKQLASPSTSLQDRAILRSKIGIASNAAQNSYNRQIAQTRLLEQQADPLKQAGNIVQIGTDLAGLGVAGFAGKEFGTNTAKLGFKQAAKKALPAIGQNAAINTIQGGAGELQSNDPTVAGALRKAAVGGAVGTLTDLTLGGFAALPSHRAYKNVVKELANETDGQVVRDTIKQIANDLPEETIDDISKQITKATDEATVDGVLRKAALEEGKLTNPVRPTFEKLEQVPVTPGVVTKDPSIILGFKQAKTPGQAKDAVKALFPELDDKAVNKASQELAKATDDNTVYQALERAQAQREAVTKAVDNVTPTGEVAPTPEQQVAEVAQEQPTAQLTSTQAPDPNIQANQVIAPEAPTTPQTRAVADANSNIVVPETVTNADSLSGQFQKQVVDKDANYINYLKKVEKETGQTGLVDQFYLDSGLQRRSNSIANNQTANSENLTNAFYGLTGDAKKQFDEYVTVRNEISNAQRGLKTADTLEALQAREAQLAGEYGDRFASLNEFYKEWAGRLRNAGLIDEPTFNSFVQNNDYTHIQRVMDDLAGYSGGGGNSFSLGQTRARLKRTGSERAVQPADITALNYAQKMQNEIQRNQTASNIIDVLVEQGHAKKLASDQAARKNTIRRIVNGKTEIFQVPRDIKEIADQISPFQLGTLGKIVAAPQRVLRAGATGLSAPFTVANYVKDQAGVAVLSKDLVATSLNPKNAAEGLFRAAQETLGADVDNDVWQKFISVGGDSTGYDFIRNVKSAKKASREVRLGKAGKYANMAGSPIRTLEDLNSITERATRFQSFKGVYEKALKQTGNEAEALRQATLASWQNSVDFSRMGNTAQAINLLIPYFNAGIQGTRLLGRRLGEAPVATSMKALGLVALPVTGATLYNLADPERRAVYENISDYEKENNVIIVLPGAEQQKDGSYTNVIKIPIQKGLINLAQPFRMQAENFSKVADQNEIAKMSQQFFGAFAGPIETGSIRGFAGGLIPQVAKPVVQQAMNKDLYTGKPIVPDYINEATDAQGNPIPESKKAYDFTSGTAKFVGGKLGVSPLRVEKAIRDTTSKVGLYGLNAVDNAVAKTQGDNILTAKNESNFNIGGISAKKDIARRFTQAQGNYNFKKSAGGKYYDLVKEATKGLNTNERNAHNALHPSKTNFLDETIFDENKRLTKYAKAGLYLQYPKVFAADKAIEMEMRKQGSPANPLYDLPQDQLTKTLLKDALPPGAKDEELSNLYQQEWYKDFKNKQSAYYTNLKAKLEKEGKSMPASKNPYPVTPPDLQKVMDSYSSLPKGTGARSGWIRSNPGLWKQMTDQWGAIDAWENKERVAIGLNPLDNTQDSTGGSGYGKFGYGKGGKSGSGNGSTKKEKTPKTYITELLGNVPNISSDEIAIRTAPKRAKFKVKTPGGKGRNYKKIKLG